MYGFRLIKKWFSRIYFYHEKYERKSNIIKISKNIYIYILKLFNFYMVKLNKMK